MVVLSDAFFGCGFYPPSPLVSVMILQEYVNGENFQGHRTQRIYKEQRIFVTVWSLF
jgi:hypothetical protein